MFLDDIFTTKNGEKLNLKEIFPEIQSKNQRKSIEFVDIWSKNRLNLPPLSIGDLKRSIIDYERKEISLDNTFCKSFEDLFFTPENGRKLGISSEILNKGEISAKKMENLPEISRKTDFFRENPKKLEIVAEKTRKIKILTENPRKTAEILLETNFDTTFCENIENLFNFNAETTKPKKNEENTSDIRLDFDFSFDFGLETKNSEKNRVSDVVPPSPEICRIPASLPIRGEEISSSCSTFVDQSCSPIFKSKYSSKTQSQKPFAAVKPFKINEICKFLQFFYANFFKVKEIF